VGERRHQATLLLPVSGRACRPARPSPPGAAAHDPQKGDLIAARKCGMSKQQNNSRARGLLVLRRACSGRKHRALGGRRPAGFIVIACTGGGALAQRRAGQATTWERVSARAVAVKINATSPRRRYSSCAALFSSLTHAFTSLHSRIFVAGARRTLPPHCITAHYFALHSADEQDGGQRRIGGAFLALLCSHHSSTCHMHLSCLCAISSLPSPSRTVCFAAWVFFQGHG